MSIKNSLEKLKAAMQIDSPDFFKPKPGTWGPYSNCCTKAIGDGTYSVFCGGRLVAHGTLDSLGKAAIRLPACP